MDIIDSALLDSLGEKASSSPRLRANFNFHRSPDAPSQRLLNALEPGTRVPAHRHLSTDETYVVLRGKLRVIFFDDNGNATESRELSPAAGTFGVNISAGTWHGLDVLERGTVIFETKDGPYTPIAPENTLNLPTPQ